MGIRRRLCLATIALAAGAVAVPVAAASSGAPLDVHVSEARCQDFSKLTSALPEMADQMPSKMPTVQVDLHGKSDRSVPYQVTKGESAKASGSVGPGGHARSVVSVSEDNNAPLRVSSGEQVLYERNVRASC